MSAAALAETLSLLRGERGLTRTRVETAKLERSFLFEDLDLTLSVRGVECRRATARLPRTYDWPKLVPSLVSGILRRASVDRLASPSFVALPRDGLSFNVNVWFAHSDAQVSLVVRKPEREVREVLVISGGQLPPFAELPRPQPAYRSYDTSRECPHCRAMGREYRELRDALVCRACGRSFPAIAFGR